MRRLENRFGGESGEEEEDLFAKTAPAAMDRGNARASTASSSKSRKGDTLGRAQTAAGVSPERAMHLKLFKKEALAESLNILKVSYNHSREHSRTL
jgi:hypothetical protein